MQAVHEILVGSGSVLSLLCVCGDRYAKSRKFRDFVVKMHSFFRFFSATR